MIYAKSELSGYLLLPVKCGVKELRIKIEEDNPPLFNFRDIAPHIYGILDQEEKIAVWLDNFPYCVLNDKSRDHIFFDKKYQGEKIRKCRACQYNKICRGFPRGYFEKFGIGEVRPIPNLPVEVMIEVEPRCNLNCQWCFNKVSFAHQGRNIGNKLTTAYVKKVIDGTAKAGVKIVRFTGGEPLLRQDIFELMKYAKNKGLEVRLNTNGNLIDSIAVKKLAGMVDNVLISIESWRDETEDKITGGAKSLTKKRRALDFLSKAKIPVLRVGTVATRKNILNFDKLAKFILNLPVQEWEFYRPVFSAGDKGNLNSSDIARLADKIITIRKKTKIWISLANAMPFCAIRDKNKMNAVCSGALFDEGHRRLVIDPRGFAKPHYFIDQNIGDPLDILGAWQHPWMKKMRNVKSLPIKCQRCPFVQKCCGGSRYWAKITYGRWRAKDPLAIY